MANQLTFRSGSGINLTANTTDKSITIATEGTVPSASTPLTPAMGGLGRTDMGNQIDGLAGATTASAINPVATMNDVNAVNANIPTTAVPLPINKGGTGRTDLTNHIAALVGGENPSATNVFITVSDLPARIDAIVPPTPAYWVYGIIINENDSNPSTCITATDDLVNKIVENFGEKPCIFKNGSVNYYLNPNNFNLRDNGNSADITSGSAGDVMIEIPKMAYYIERVGTNIVVKLTNHSSPKSLDSRYCLYSHSRDIEGDRDKIYLGAYLGWYDSRLRSLSGKTLTNNKTIGQFRTLANNTGANYGINRFYVANLLQVMYLMKYKNLNSQQCLGQGITSSSVTATGGTETNGMYWGDTIGGSSHVKFAGIEDWYGNYWQWTDGLCTNNSTSLFYYAWKNFNDTCNGYNTFNGTIPGANWYVKKILGTPLAGFIADGSVTSGGSGTTYYSDYQYYYQTTSPDFALYGGNSSYGSNRGLS